MADFVDPNRALAARDAKMRTKMLQDLWQRLASVLISTSKSDRDQIAMLMTQLQNATASERKGLIEIYHGPQTAERCMPVLIQIETLTKARSAT